MKKKMANGSKAVTLIFRVHTNHTYDANDLGNHHIRAFQMTRIIPALDFEAWNASCNPVAFISYANPVVCHSGRERPRRKLVVYLPVDDNLFHFVSTFRSQNKPNRIRWRFGQFFLIACVPESSQIIQMDFAVTRNIAVALSLDPSIRY